MLSCWKAVANATLSRLAMRFPKSEPALFSFHFHPRFTSTVEAFVAARGKQRSHFSFRETRRSARIVSLLPAPSSDAAPWRAARPSRRSARSPPRSPPRPPLPPLPAPPSACATTQPGRRSTRARCRSGGAMPRWVSSYTSPSSACPRSTENGSSTIGFRRKTPTSSPSSPRPRAPPSPTRTTPRASTRLFSTPRSGRSSSPPPVRGTLCRRRSITKASACGRLPLHSTGTAWTSAPCATSLASSQTQRATLECISGYTIVFSNGTMRNTMPTAPRTGRRTPS